ncbi:MAG: hypothetical protein KAJ36_02955, partial [Candidatus Thorarchaeota archaeon]|nr:hypothetical protein [Candidatus Thorarchaeota archaeon]
MQLVVQYASEIVTGIGIFIATLLLGRYTLNRISQLPEEEKSLGKPLWVATIGILLLGVASIINYVVAIGFADFEMYYYLAGVGGGGFLAFAATMIMGWKKGQALPIVLSIALMSVTLIEY